MRRLGTKWIKHLVVIIVGLLMIYPILWLISSSLKPSNEIFTQTSLWIRHLTFKNYLTGWQGIEGISFGRFFVNSFIISTLSVLGNVVSCSLTAYAFARLNFRFKGLWFALMIMTIMLPNHVKLIPQYIIFHDLGWINTIWPLVVPHWLATDSFFILLIVQFIRGIPRELDESARIDGCGHFSIYFRMILPLSRPALITTALFTFYWTWDDFFSQMIYLNNVKGFTVPLGLMSMVAQTGISNWGGLFAMSFLGVVPVIILFLLFQKYFVEGISTTGLK